MDKKRYCRIEFCENFHGTTDNNVHFFLWVYDSDCPECLVLRHSNLLIAVCLLHIFTQITNSWRISYKMDRKDYDPSRVRWYRSTKVFSVWPTFRSTKYQNETRSHCTEKRNCSDDFSQAHCVRISCDLDFLCFFHFLICFVFVFGHVKTCWTSAGARIGDVARSIGKWHRNCEWVSVVR